MARVLLFGSCLLRGSFLTARREAKSDPTWAEIQGDIVMGGVPFFTRTLGEAHQAIEVYRGEKYLWPEIRTLCNMPPTFRANARLGVRHVDAFLFEPDSNREITLQGFHLSYPRVRDFVVSLSPEDSPLREKMLRWYSYLIAGGDSSTFASDGSEIAAALASSRREDDFAECLFRNTIVTEMSLRDRLERLRSLVQGPIGVVGHTTRYSESGLPTEEAAAFLRSSAQAAADLGLPYFNPDSILQAYGAARALKEDLLHYRPEFMPVIARALLGFARGIAATREAAPQIRPRPVATARAAPADAL